MERSRLYKENSRLRKNEHFFFFLLRTYDATYHFLAVGLKHPIVYFLSAEKMIRTLTFRVA